MFEINPFAELSTTVSVEVMQGFVTIMIALVAGGTLFDIIHKGSAKYFFQRWSREKKSRQREPSLNETVSTIAKTTAHDVLTQGEFCSFKRRLAHLLSMCPATRGDSTMAKGAEYSACGPGFFPRGGALCAKCYHSGPFLASPRSIGSPHVFSAHVQSYFL